MTSIVIRHGDVRRDRRTVLTAGQITAPLPAAVALVGINGSGKTSLFMHVARTLARQRAPASVSLAGRAVTRIGYAPQTPSLPLWLDGAQAAPLFGCCYDELCEAMPGLYLEELRGRRIGMLSLGQQQALSLAFALGGGAPLLVLDEPFAALDFRRRLGALALLRAWQQQSGDRGMLLSSQNAADLIDVCNHFVVVRNGTYVFNGARALLTCGAAAADELQMMETRLLRLLS